MLKIKAKMEWNSDRQTDACTTKMKERTNKTISFSFVLSFWYSFDRSRLLNCETDERQQIQMKESKVKCRHRIHIAHGVFFFLYHGWNIWKNQTNQTELIRWVAKCWRNVTHKYLLLFFFVVAVVFEFEFERRCWNEHFIMIWSLKSFILLGENCIF